MAAGHYARVQFRAATFLNNAVVHCASVAPGAGVW